MGHPNERAAIPLDEIDLDQPRSRRNLLNVLGGFLNLAVGFALLFAFAPKGADVILEWALVAPGALVISLFLARHFGRVRSVRHSAGAS